jgi:RNA polymerase-binding transcription factor DksA
MVTMSTLPGYDSSPNDDRHRERRERLLQARTLRLEQLAASEHGPAALPQQSLQRAVHIAATTELAEIDAALDRMERGVYGQCVTCARPIPEDRLDVLPMAPQCLPCHYNDQNCRLDRRV